MRSSCSILKRSVDLVVRTVAFALLVSAGSSAQTLQQVQDELALVRTKLALAEAKLALAQREAELALVQSRAELASASRASTAADASVSAPSLVALAAAAPRQQLGAPVKTTVTTSTTSAAAPPTEGPQPAPQKSDPDAKAELRGAGIVKLNSLLPLERNALLGANGVPPDTFMVLIKAPANATLCDVAKLLAKKRALSRDPTGSAPDAEKTAAKQDLQNLDTLLVSLGFEVEKERARAAGTPPNPSFDAAAKAHGRTALIQIPAKSPEDVALRNAGISFSQGFGVAFSPSGRGSDATLGTLIARWNWLQRSAAGKWNRWVGENNAEGDAQVPYRGRIEYWLGRRQYTDARPPERRSKTLPEFTAFGPFLGTAITGDKVKFGSEEERPWIIGLSTGWGFYKDAASLLYIDVGAAASPSSGLDHAQLFAGASLDAIVLGRILGLTRKAHLPTETDK